MKFETPPLPQFQAFTLTSNSGRLLRIVTDVGVSLPFVPEQHADPRPAVHKTTALWDTGASHSVITKSVASSLGLIPSSMTRLSHVNGVSDANSYLVNLYLPNSLMIHTVRVSEIENKDFGVLIGMDIITLGDFAITNVNGLTKVSFRFPSLEEIDYVVVSNQINSLAIKANAVGRNALCPCGSGRKYKNCHGRSVR